MYRVGFASWLVWVVLVPSWTAAEDGVEVLVQVAAGAYDRADEPVSVPLPESLRQARDLSVQCVETEKVFDAQIVPGQSAQVVWILDRPLAAGTSRTYRLMVAASDANPPGAAMRCEDTGRQLILFHGDRPVLKYHHAVAEPPDGIDPVYRRSGHIHPLLTPAGRAVTDDFSPDHPHQHGVFFAWVNTTRNGHHVDFWNQREQTGRVEHVAIEQTIDGPVFAQFRVRLLHSDITDAEEPTPVLDEWWTVRTYRVRGRFLVDVESTQICRQGALQINQYHYGGFAIRGQRQWHAPTGESADGTSPQPTNRFAFVTSEGLDRQQGNHSRPRWVSMAGPVDDQLATVTIMGHPDNFRFPQPVRLHPSKPYFCFAPMVTGAFSLEAGRPYTSRYRLLVYDGPLDLSRNEHAWHNFTHPPK